jgi:60 kDa SS-A/Ro ribonucleoprotein
MTRINTKKFVGETVDTEVLLTHGGARAVKIGKIAQLRRAVLSTLLFEDQFYEDGASQADRIRELALAVDPETLADLAVEARRDHGLRHVSLLLLVQLMKTGSGIQGLVSDTIVKVCTRADMVTDLLALYSADKTNKAYSGQLKKGVARALEGFDRYQIAKYASNRGGKAFDLRRAMFISHPRSHDEVAARTLGDLVQRKLRQEGTWESQTGEARDMSEVFTRLLLDGKLGYLALLRNLRKMSAAGVSKPLIKGAILARSGASGIFPLQYHAAAMEMPEFADVLEEAMLAEIRKGPRLNGRTIIVGDVSGSMQAGLSGKGKYTRYDATALLIGSLVAMCDDPVVYATAGSDSRRQHATTKVTSTAGFGMVDVLRRANATIGQGGIFLTQVMDFIADREQDIERVIVLTDEQDCDISGNGAPAKAKLLGSRNYLINVGSNENGIGYRRWTHIDGFTDTVIKWIPVYEREIDDEQTN